MGTGSDFVNMAVLKPQIFAIKINLWGLIGSATGGMEY